MAKICFVSYDILGPIKNGGIGTAMTAAAEALAAEGHDVTILYPSSYTEDKSLSYWTLAFERRGIAFRSLFSEEGPLANAYLVYQWLKKNPFDVVHFHDWRGPGYWSCIAKRQKLAFRDTTLVCQVHGQTYWHLTSSSEFLSEVSELELDFLERRAVEFADAVFSPSAYMLDFMRERDWRIPENAFVSPNLLPDGFDTDLAAETTTPGSRVPVDELVFFGRLEARKGVELFCEAVSRALKSGVPIRRITFLGKEGRCGPEPATAVISRAAAGWSAPYSIINDHDVFGARRYLAGPRRLAVIASAIENSPYTVLEGLASGLPFISADVGGVAELIAPEDRADVLFSRDPRALAAKLAQCVARGALVARPAIGIAEARRRWLAWHETLLPKPSAPKDAVEAPLPLVSVCISHFSRPHLLRVAIDSVEAQTYPNLQVVLFDDASPDAATKAYLDAIAPRFSERGWKIVRNGTEVWTGAARNLAVSHADGEYVLLMDDDNVARPEEVATFVTAALATGADVLTCQQQPFVGAGAPPEGRAELPIGWMALGPHLSQALFQNCLGDLNMMVRRSVWERLGGFTTDLYGCEDWEFLVKAILEGCHLEVVPEMLFCYRHSEASLGYRYGPDALYKSNIRPLRPVLEKLRPDLRMALQLAVETRQQSVRRNREGYWRQRGSLNSTSVRIGKLPLNTGEALVEMAQAALKREQFESAILLYTQALRNAPSNRVALFESVARWGGDLSTDVLVEFLGEPAVYEEADTLPVFIDRARLLEERGEDKALLRVLKPALMRHPENQTLRMMLGFAAYRLGEHDEAAGIMFRGRDLRV